MGAILGGWVLSEEECVCEVRGVWFLLIVSVGDVRCGALGALGLGEVVVGGVRGSSLFEGVGEGGRGGVEVGICGGAVVESSVVVWVVWVVGRVWAGTGVAVVVVVVGMVGGVIRVWVCVVGGVGLCSGLHTVKGWFVGRCEVAV